MRNLFTVTETGDVSFSAIIKLSPFSYTESRAGCEKERFPSTETKVPSIKPQFFPKKNNRAPIQRTKNTYFISIVYVILIKDGTVSYCIYDRRSEGFL
jgi:hypothetical protein